MAPVAYNFKKGVDLPSWHWLSPFPGGISSPGTASAYDGSRYIYWAIQFGVVTAAAGTTQLYRYDTWNNGWQFLTALANSNLGLDVEYDSVRNVVYVMAGVATTTIACFNLNTTAVTINNISCAPWALTTLAALPATATLGSSLTMPDSSAVPAIIDTGISTAASTTTSIVDSTTGKSAGTYGVGMVGLQVRFTTGALAGQHRIISTVAAPNTLTVAAFGGAPAVGDAFVVEVPTGVLTAGSTTSSLPATGETWAVNQYANQDVIMTSGAAVGQRRRITSNTANTLTLAAAVTGNARTGALANAPATGDTFQIVPSQDFLYFQPGNGTTALYRLDVVQTVGSAWSALLGAAPSAIGPGSNTFYPYSYAPFSLIAFRGAASVGVLLYDMGLNTWRTVTTFAGSETFTTGNASAMVHGKRKIFVQKEASQRCYILDLTTGILEPAGFMPYAAPVAYDGKRARHLQTVDGVDWLYIIRAGGQEFFRVPLEWV